MELLDIVLSGFGIVFLSAAIFNWDWFWSLSKVNRMADFLGKGLARIFYGLVGIAFLFFGLYKYLKQLSVFDTFLG